MGEILFLAHRIPFPPDRGDKIRSFHILRHLCGLARVHLACFADDPGDAAHLSGLRSALGDGLGQCFVEVRPRNRLRAVRALATGEPLSTALFRSAALQAFVDRMLASRPLDVIFAFSGQMAQFVPATAASRFVMDFVDADSAKFADYGASGRGPTAWLYRREADRLLVFERATALRADVSLFVSEAEAALFQRRIGSATADIRALGNGIDLGFYDPEAGFEPLAAKERGAGPLIVFTGQMDYRPNVEAVAAFAHDVMPRLRERWDDARFAIVGRNPTDIVRSLDGRNGTRVTGAVPDVRSWLAAADVVVAPLRIARGIQNKVLEALAMGRPTMVSSAALEGIDAQPGVHLLLADGADAQAEAVSEVLADPARAAMLGRAGRQRMHSQYSWTARLAPLGEIMGFRSRAAA